MRAELCHADGQTDRHDEANCHGLFCKFSHASKKYFVYFCCFSVEENPPFYSYERNTELIEYPVNPNDRVCWWSSLDSVKAT